MKTGPLKRLKVTNFQRHALLDIDDLSPGVNVFVGRSGQGKSAGVFRPLWLLYANRPVGDEYAYDPEIVGLSGTKWDNGPTKVESWWNDPDGETYVSRIRGKDTSKDNYYDLGDGIKRRGFGNGSPPEEIMEALNLEDLNFDSQHDSLYLLSAKATEVAKELNGIVGLDDIDRAYEYVNGRKWKEAQEKKTQKALVDSYSTNLAKYSRLEDLESKLIVIEELEKRAKEARNKASWLRSKTESLKQAQSEVMKYKNLPSLVIAYGNILGKFKELSGIEDRIDSLREISDKLRSAESNRQTFSSLGKAELRLADLSYKLETLETVRTKSKNLRSLSSRLKQVQNDRLQASKDLKVAEKEFHALVKDRCPICGRGGKQR